MRALLQRVSHAAVRVNNKIIGKIEKGFVVLLGVSQSDSEEESEYLVNKIVNLRIFSDDEDKFNLSALDVGAELLIISQFTLYADTRRGRRPGFTDAAPPPVSIPLYEKTVELFKATGLKIETGEFGANMQVEIHNDGPVTIMLDSDDKNDKKSK